jgi:hypothetical protein
MAGSSQFARKSFENTRVRRCVRMLGHWRATRGYSRDNQQQGNSHQDPTDTKEIINMAAIKLPHVV